MEVCPQCGKEFERRPDHAGLLCAACTAAEPPARTSAVPTAQATPARVTLGLIAINCAVFAAMVLAGVSPVDPTAEQVLPWGANFGPQTLAGEWWRAFTCMFLHFGVLHLCMNMWCLLDLGRMAEKAFGRWPFLSLYLISGLGGSAVSLRWNPEVVSAGASGAVFGIAGSLLSALHGRKLRLAGASQKRLTSVATFVGYNVLFGLTNSGIDNAAHIGGLAVGFVLGYLIPFASEPDQRGVAQRKSGAIFAAVGLAVVSLFWAARNAQGFVVQVEEARALINAEKHDAAVAMLRAVTKENPQYAEAHMLLGFALMKKNEDDVALEEFNQAIAVRPMDVFAHFYSGVIHSENGQYDQAIPLFVKATQLNPSFWEAHHNRGLAHYMKEEYPQAIAAYQTTLRLQPNDAGTHYNLGLAFLDSDQIGPAIASFRRAVELKPDDPAMYVGLASAYESKKMLKEAAEAWAKHKELLKQASSSQ
jgi:membrane associated rhomboid family serine protease/Flp pilus assembly protein TadD